MKNTDKKILVVRGSHDGIIGVYTNFKLAHKKAMQYMRNENVHDGLDSYSKAIKQYKRQGCLYMECDDCTTTVDITWHWLND